MPRHELRQGTHIRNHAGPQTLQRGATTVLPPTPASSDRTDLCRDTQGLPCDALRSALTLLYTGLFTGNTAPLSMGSSLSPRYCTGTDPSAPCGRRRDPSWHRLAPACTQRRRPAASDRCQGRCVLPWPPIRWHVDGWGFSSAAQVGLPGNCMVVSSIPGTKQNKNNLGRVRSGDSHGIWHFRKTRAPSTADS